MIFTLIMDLQEEYLAKNKEIVEFLSKKNRVIRPEEVKEGDMENPLVLTDDVNATEKWKTYAVIGIEHTEEIRGVDYVAEELFDVDEEYMSLVYHRKHGILRTIAKTKRLVIREVGPNDAEDICRLYEDKEAVRYIPPIHGVMEEKEYMQAYVKNMYGFYGYGMWGVIRESDNRLIGRVGIENRTMDGKVFCELGYFIGAEYQGNGYALEAAQAVMLEAKRLGICELIAYIHKKNTPSIRLAQKLGFCFWQESYDGAKFLVYRKIISHPE